MHESEDRQLHAKNDPEVSGEALEARFSSSGCHCRRSRGHDGGKMTMAWACLRPPQRTVDVVH